MFQTKLYNKYSVAVNLRRKTSTGNSSFPGAARLSRESRERAPEVSHRKKFLTKAENKTLLRAALDLLSALSVTVCVDPSPRGSPSCITIRRCSGVCLADVADGRRSEQSEET